MIEVEVISNINDPRLNLFSKVSETELAHFYEPLPGLFLAESIKVLDRCLSAGYEPECALVEDSCIDEVMYLIKRYADIFGYQERALPVYVAPFENLKNITGYHMTGGVICVMRRKTLPTVEDICLNATKIAILEDVVNPTNIGAIFRNAAGLSIDGILLSPGCCDPLYKRAVRVSMGTVFQIPWTFIPKKNKDKEETWPLDTMEYLHDQGYLRIAMALDERAISIDDTKLRDAKKKAILLGNEGEGLNEDTLKLCDYTVMIPMSNNVDSLNVAAASALAFWELGR